MVEDVCQYHRGACVLTLFSKVVTRDVFCAILIIVSRRFSIIRLLSHFFKVNTLEYYEHLQKIRDAGDWESWLMRRCQRMSMMCLQSMRKVKRSFWLKVLFLLVKSIAYLLGTAGWGSVKRYGTKRAIMPCTSEL